MITRRTFLAGATAFTLAPLVARLVEAHARTGEVEFIRPPKVERRFYLHREEKGLRLVTDAVEFPLPIVQFDAFEEKLGPGSYRRHTQRDHWRMIEEG